MPSYKARGQEACKAKLNSELCERNPNSYLRILLGKQAGEADRLEGGEVGPPVRVFEANPFLSLLGVHVEDGPGADTGVVDLLDKKSKTMPKRVEHYFTTWFVEHVFVLSEMCAERSTIL